MAERKINSQFLFKSYHGSAGEVITSDPIDLREIAVTGDVSISCTIGAYGTNATCGSSKVSYLGSPVYDGTYISPTNGTCATLGNIGGADIIPLSSAPVMPFMKVRVSIGTSADAVLTAAIHAR